MLKNREDLVDRDLENINWSDEREKKLIMETNEHFSFIPFYCLEDRIL